MFTEHLLCAKFKAHFKFIIVLSIVKSSSTCKVTSEIFNTPCIFKICTHTCVCLWVFAPADQLCWIHLQLELHSFELSHMNAGNHSLTTEPSLQLPPCMIMWGNCCKLSTFYL